MPTNTFYIAANIIFDLRGDTKDVLMLVNKAEDASVFNSEDAQKYLNFVKQRSRGFVWSIEPLASTPPEVVMKALGLPRERYIIKGVQYV